jgi:hypothetical protein
MADRLLGLSSTFVEDLLQAGTEESRAAVVSELKNRFEITGSVETPLTFAGFEVQEYSRSQSTCIHSLKSLSEYTLQRV